MEAGCPPCPGEARACRTASARSRWSRSPRLIQLATPSLPDAQSGRLRDNAVYRGAGEALLTGLDRLGTPAVAPHSKGDLEEHLLRNFMRYSRPHLRAPVNQWELLIVAQHHGLPTRLLDWTYSPLVAAHFATLGGRGDADCVVWKFNWQPVHEQVGFPRLALMVEDLEQVRGARGFQSPWNLFQNGRRRGHAFVCMIEPPALDVRIVAQSATFTLSSDKTRPLELIPEDIGLASALTRFVIPAAAVPRIRDQLDLCSVDERRLFPDLDGVAAEMRRYYASSADTAARAWSPAARASGQRRARRGSKPHASGRPMRRRGKSGW